MKIQVLIENSKKDEDLICAHGLSIYIEVSNKKILLDTGANGDFIQNAKKMGVDLKTVEFVIISHFHYDHAGGLKAFLMENNIAKVYIAKTAFDDYYVFNNDDSRMGHFGLNKEQFDLNRFVFVEKEIELDKGLKIISKLNYDFDNSLNDKFYKKIGGDFIQDDFSHEIALVINEEDKTILISGCFHSGVINSVKRANELGQNVTHVIGGFHLAGSNGIKVSHEYFEKLYKFLKSNSITCYTGHCTGEYYYSELNNGLAKQVQPIFTGVKYNI